MVMMMLIEYVNIQSRGNIFNRLKSSPVKQVFAGAILGLIPGCIGGFAVVSLYTHRMLSFGALVAMMVASTGDESFIMLAVIPKTAIILFALLFLLAVATGLLVDKFNNRERKSLSLRPHCRRLLVDSFNRKESAPFEGEGHFAIHDDCGGTHDHSGEIFNKKTLSNFSKISRERILIMLGISLFVIAIIAGVLEHGHGTPEMSEVHLHENDMHAHTHLDIFSERWINLMFALVGIFALYLTAKANDHFIKIHLWNHVIRKHLLSIFLWTFSALLIIHVGLQYLHIERWIGDNIYLMILLAALVGLIPESGPHIVFISMFAGGMVPFSVLLSNSIVQDGHTALPLLVESKKSFLEAKLINIAIGIATAMGLHFLTGI